MEPEKYHIIIRILHWLMALIVISLIAVGWFMSDLDKTDSSRATLYFLHKSFGVTILLLFVIRVIAKIRTKTPKLPEGLSANTRKTAHAAHHTLYLFMFAIPFSGYAMSNLFGYGVGLFTIPMPTIFSKNIELGKVAHEIQEVGAYIFLAIIIAHITGAIKHRFSDNGKNNILDRML